MRREIKYTALLLAAACGHSDNQQRLPAPIEKSTALAAQSEQTQKAAALVKGESLKSAGQEYAFLPEMKAQPAGAAEKGRFQIYESKNAEGAAPKVALSTNDKGLVVHPTALNARTQQIGVVTGTYRVHLIEGAKAADLAKAFSLRLTRSFESIRLAFFEVAPDVDMVELLNKLKADARVESAEIEVLENFKSAK